MAVAIAAVAACSKGAGGNGPASGANGTAAAPTPVPAPPAKTAIDAAPPAPTAFAATKGASVRDELLAEAAGKPVALHLDDAGRLASTAADGAITHVLAPGPFVDAIHDDPRDLIWVRTDRGLAVVDLRARTAEPLLIVAFVDAKNEHLHGEMDRAPDWSPTSAFSASFSYCGEGDTISGGGGLGLSWEPGGWNGGDGAAAQGVRLDGAEWLRANVKREQRRASDKVYPFGESRKKVKIPASAGDCGEHAGDEEYGECGANVPFGRTGAYLVATHVDQSQCPAAQCRLWTPSQKKWSPVLGLDPDAEGARTCGPFFFDVSGAVVLHREGRLCTADGACRTIGRRALGWLGGSIQVSEMNGP
jgi:hypothetical protein